MWQAMKDWGQLIKEATREPTHVKELVVGESAYLQGNAGCLWRRSRRRVASGQKKLHGTRGVEGRNATGSQKRPDDVGKPKRHNNKPIAGDGCRAAGVPGTGSQCAIETQTCGFVLRQLSHSAVADARGIQEVSCSKQAAEGAAAIRMRKQSVTTSHTSPFW